MHGNCVEVLTPMSWKGDTCSWFGGDELCQRIRRREFDQSHDAWINAVDTKNKGTRCGGMVDWIVWMNDTSRKCTVSLAFNHSHGCVELLVGNNKNRGLFADREASIFASLVSHQKIAMLEIQTGINRLSIALLSLIWRQHIPAFLCECIIERSLEEWFGSTELLKVLILFIVKWLAERQRAFAKEAREPCLAQKRRKSGEVQYTL